MTLGWLLWLVVAAVLALTLFDPTGSLVTLLPAVADNFIPILYFLFILLTGLLLEGRDRQNLGTSALAKKSPRQLRKIARRYQYKITGKAGNTWGRVLVFGLCIYLIGWGAWWTSSFLPVPNDIRWTLIVGVTIVVVLLISDLFIVNVPKLAFVIVTNILTGRTHVLITGLMIKYPWETFEWGDVVETEEEREEINSDVISLRTAEVRQSNRFIAKDGIGVTFLNWMIQWSIFQPLAVLNIRFDVENISDNIRDILVSFLNQEILQYTAAQLRNPDVINRIEEEFVRRLSKANRGDVDALSSTVQERAGTVVEMGTLGHVRFDIDHEETISLDTNLGIMQKRAEAMAGSLNIDGGQAMDNVLIAAKENVSRRAVKLEMDPSTRETVEKVGGKIGTVAGAIASAVASKDEHGGGNHSPPPSGKPKPKGGH